MEINTTFSSNPDATLALVIARRAERLFDPYLDVMTIVMDLAACHNHAVELNLVKFASGRDEDIIHDVAGINSYLNRRTGELENCFVPRFAKD